MSIKHALKQDAAYRYYYALPRRHNTRRNRERALNAWWNRNEQLLCNVNSDLTPEQRVARNKVCLVRAQGLACHVAAGLTIKRISSWSGVPVRILTRFLSDYYQRRLPGQREVEA